MLGMLNTLFEETAESSRKIKKLHDDYGIEISEDLKQEVDDMGNINYYYLEKGIEQGIAKGIEQGINRGALLKSAENICSLIKKKNFTKEEALQLLDVSEEDWEEVSRLVDEKLKKGLVYS